MKISQKLFLSIEKHLEAEYNWIIFDQKFMTPKLPTTIFSQHSSQSHFASITILFCSKPTQSNKQQVVERSFLFSLSFAVGFSERSDAYRLFCETFFT